MIKTDNNGRAKLSWDSNLKLKLFKNIESNYFINNEIKLIKYGKKEYEINLIENKDSKNNIKIRKDNKKEVQNKSLRSYNKVNNIKEDYRVDNKVDDFSCKDKSIQDEDFDKLISGLLDDKPKSEVVIKKSINKKEVSYRILKILTQQGKKTKEDLFKDVARSLDENCIIDQKIMEEEIEILFKEKKISMRHGVINLREVQKLTSVKSNRLECESNLISNSDDSIKIKYISLEDITMVMMKILLDTGEKTKKSLFKCVLEFLGDKTSEKECEKYLIEGIDLLSEENKIYVYMGKIKLNKSKVNIDEIKNFKKDKLNSVYYNSMVKNDEGKKNIYYDELCIDNVFNEERFNDFKKFCNYNKIKKVTDITYDDIMDFKFEKNVERKILAEIAQIVNQYEYEYSKSNINIEL